MPLSVILFRIFKLFVSDVGSYLFQPIHSKISIFALSLGSQISSARHDSSSLFGVADGYSGGGSSPHGLKGINGSHSSSYHDNSGASDRHVPDDEFINLLVRTQVRIFTISVKI